MNLFLFYVEDSFNILARIEMRRSMRLKVAINSYKRRRGQIYHRVAKGGVGPNSYKKGKKGKTSQDTRRNGLGQWARLPSEFLFRAENA